jgi:GGDEF domain-containing protein
MMPFPHSCSVGLAGWRDGESADTVMHRADQALYSAKRAGRNRAVAA